MPSVRSGSSGSAIHTGLHAQARVAVPSTLPHGIERTKAARSGPSGSVIGTLRPEWQCHPHCHSTLNVQGRYAQARVAVPSTRDCTFRPEWQCYPHCHSTLNVWGQYAQARVAVRVGVTFGSVGVMPTSERLDRGVPQPRPGRPPRKWQSVSVREGRFLGRFG